MNPIDLTASAQFIKRIAVVRFSALGDVLLAVAAVEQLQKYFTSAEITWFTSPQAILILEGLPNIRFVVVEKPRALGDYLKFYSKFKHEKFDLVLAMQASFRINLFYPALHAPIKIGFDKTRARDGQSFFTTHAIASVESQAITQRHLLDSFFAFGEILGVPRSEDVTWHLPISDNDHEWAEAQLKNLAKPILLIHPCASKAERNWPESRLLEVVSVVRKWGCGIVFTGGNSPHELAVCERLSSAAGIDGLNLCGKSTPKQLAAILARTQAVLAPDTFVVHLARAMNTRVVGLYAVAPSSLSGPYQRTEYCVDRYEQAIATFLHRNPATVACNTRAHHPQTMALISVEDVIEKLRLAMALN